jgi:hypothetical protein
MIEQRFESTMVALDSWTCSIFLAHCNFEMQYPIIYGAY